MTVVFSFLRNCSGCKDDDFRDEGRVPARRSRNCKSMRTKCNILVRGKKVRESVAPVGKDTVGEVNATDDLACTNILAWVLVHTGIDTWKLFYDSATTRGDIMFSGRLSVRPSVDVCPLTLISCDAISLYFVKEFQWNPLQIFVMWVTTAGRFSRPPNYGRH